MLYALTKELVSNKDILSTSKNICMVLISFLSGSFRNKIKNTDVMRPNKMQKEAWRILFSLEEHLKLANAERGIPHIVNV